MHVNRENSSEARIFKDKFQLEIAVRLVVAEQTRHR